MTIVPTPNRTASNTIDSIAAVTSTIAPSATVSNRPNQPEPPTWISFSYATRRGCGLPFSTN
jgi:hypothetical protein